MDSDFVFVDDLPSPSAPPAARPPWSVLIVDDDPSVHEVTKIVLTGFEFDGRPVQFYDCYSGAEARDFLSTHDDVALILLDVVMESEHAGLDLVRYIRDDCHNRAVRIVLRTGQAGQAPEEEVIRTYDINDYKEKTELTARKMVTTFCTALRSYRDIMVIEASRAGLRRSIEAITRISASRDLRVFASTVLEQLNMLLGLRGQGICATHTSAYAASAAPGGLRILAATADYDSLRPNIELDQLPSEVRGAIEETLASKRGFCSERVYVGYRRTGLDNESVVYMSFEQPIDAAAVELLDIFSTNIAITYDSLLLREALMEAVAAGGRLCREQDTRVH